MMGEKAAPTKQHCRHIEEGVEMLSREEAGCVSKQGLPALCIAALALHQRTTSRPEYKHQSSGSYAMTVLGEAVQREEISRLLSQTMMDLNCFCTAGRLMKLLSSRVGPPLAAQAPSTTH
ncbi:hypothetical protein PAMP_022301 [Pampus punctatissimus]